MKTDVVVNEKSFGQIAYESFEDQSFDWLEMTQRAKDAWERAALAVINKYSVAVHEIIMADKNVRKTIVQMEEETDREIRRLCGDKRMSITANNLRSMKTESTPDNWPESKPRYCLWERCEEGKDLFRPGCSRGVVHCMLQGSIVPDRFCHYCGKPIRIKK